MDAGRPESAIFGRKIPSHSWHDGESVACLVGVLGVQACRRFLRCSEQVLLLSDETVEEVESLSVGIMVHGCSGAQIVLRREVRLEHQLGIAVFLCDVIDGLADAVSGIVDRTVQHQGDRSVVLRVEGETVLPMELVPVSRDFHPIVGNLGLHSSMPAHSAHASVVQGLEAELADPDRGDVSHSPHSVVLAESGHVHEVVSVPVVFALAVLEMQQGTRGKTVGKVDASVQVHFLLEIAVKVGICPHSVHALRLEILHIDLPCGALESVLHARSPFADLDALHPRPRYIAQ